MPERKYKEITAKIIGASMKVDFLVENKISVKPKAILNLEPVHLAQAGNYPEAYNVEVGLRINFGFISPQFKRLQNPKFVAPPFPLNQ